MSQPCCMKAPRENQRLLKIPNSLGGWSLGRPSVPSSGSSVCHSYGLKRLTRNEHHAHADVGEHNAHPDLVGQRVQEGEDTWFGLLGLLDHDGDAQTHEGFWEVNDLLPDQSNSQWGHSDSLLEQQKASLSTSNMLAYKQNRHNDFAKFINRAIWLDKLRK